MRKGLTQTLMTVAVAMMGFQAFAYAPVIGNVPSPIVGGSGGVTIANRFVYPDAINLDNYVTDDNTAVGSIQWSYAITTDSTHPQRYTINGVRSLYLSADNPAVPGTARIDNQVLRGEQNPDTNTRTITVRNSYLSPFTGSEQNQGSTLGILDAQTQVVTLFASDGTTYSSVDRFFYTDNGGPDRLSPGMEHVVQVTWNGSLNGWGYTGFGSATSGTSGGTALCFTTALAGDNIGMWTSPYGLFTPVAHSVYRIRATVNGSQASPGHTPFWDFYLDNYGGTGALNLFGADCYFLDGSGGANSIINTVNGQTIQMWFTPLAVETAQFNNSTTGAFISANNGKLGARLTFRTLDAAVARPDLGGANQDGQLCLKMVDIDRYPINSMQVLQPNVWSVTSLTRTTASVTGNVLVDSFVSPTISDTGGVLTITPSTSGRTAELVTVTPGTNTAYDLNNPSTIADNYPCPWTDNALYQITANLAMTDPANTWDVIYMQADEPTNEVLLDSLITGEGGRCGTPTATASTYMSFFYTHQETHSATAGFHFWRPKVAIGNSTGLSSGGSNNGSAVRISKIAVNKVQFN